MMVTYSNKSKPRKNREQQTRTEKMNEANHYRSLLRKRGIDVKAEIQLGCNPYFEGWHFKGNDFPTIKAIYESLPSNSGYANCPCCDDVVIVNDCSAPELCDDCEANSCALDGSDAPCECGETYLGDELVIERNPDWKGVDAFISQSLYIYEDDQDAMMKAIAPWARCFVRCGGGYRAFEYKADANKWEKIL
jgi:hypothetical protein